MKKFLLKIIPFYFLIPIGLILFFSQPSPRMKSIAQLDVEAIDRKIKRDAPCQNLNDSNYKIIKRGGLLNDGTLYPYDTIKNINKNISWDCVPQFCDPTDKKYDNKYSRVIFVDGEQFACSGGQVKQWSEFLSHGEIK